MKQRDAAAAPAAKYRRNHLREVIASLILDQKPATSGLQRLRRATPEDIKAVGEIKCSRHIKQRESHVSDDRGHRNRITLTLLHGNFCTSPSESSTQYRIIAECGKCSSHRPLSSMPADPPVSRAFLMLASICSIAISRESQSVLRGGRELQTLKWITSVAIVSTSLDRRAGKWAWIADSISLTHATFF